MVEYRLKPQPGEVIQDPAVGHGGFLTQVQTPTSKTAPTTSSTCQSASSSSSASQAFYRRRARARRTRRLALMNLPCSTASSPTSFSATRSHRWVLDLPKADVILTNPPFGTKKGGGRPSRDDFTFPTSNKQLAFLQHVYRST